MGTDPQLCKMKTVQEMGGGDGLHVCERTLLNFAPRDGYDGKFGVFFFNHN